MDALAKLRAEHLNVYYGSILALKDVCVTAIERHITALIGPSGCGKSTLLRVFNRMNDLIPGCRVEGTVELDGRPLASYDLDSLRKRVGMVFQRPNPFPLSVYDNIAFGPRTHALASDADVDRMLVEVFDVLRGEMRRDPGVVDRAISMIFFAKHVERLADHATNLAEMVMFLVRGEDVRHGMRR